MFSFFNRLSLFFREYIILDNDSPFNIFVNKISYSIIFVLFFILTYLIFYYLGFNYFSVFYIIAFTLSYHALFSFYSITSLYIYLFDFSLSIWDRVYFSIVFLIFSFIFVYSFFSFFFSSFIAFHDAGLFVYYSEVFSNASS